jgi:hypothetical protein
MDLNEILLPQTELIERDLGDEIVIMSYDGKKIHSFEDTALWIWKNIKEGKSPGEIVKGLIDVYDVAEDRALKDLTAFVQELREKEILRIPE